MLLGPRPVSKSALALGLWVALVMVVIASSNLGRSKPCCWSPAEVVHAPKNNIPTTAMHALSRRICIKHNPQSLLVMLGQRYKNLDRLIPRTPQQLNNLLTNQAVSALVFR